MTMVAQRPSPGPSSTAAAEKAYSGAPPGQLPLRNIFDWCFSQPYLTESDFCPAERVLPPIERDRPIFVDNKSDRALTYAQIHRDAQAVASGLVYQLGLDPTQIIKLPPTATCPQGPELAPVVLVQLPNGLPIAPVLFGTWAAGLTATLVSPALTSDEIAWILQNARPRAIITSSNCLGAMRGALAKQADQRYFAGVPIFTVDPADAYPLPPSAAGAPAPEGTQDWKTLLASPIRPRVRFPDSAAPCRTAVLLWSSGTSGRSKGVLLSHHALNFTTGALWHDADFHAPGTQHAWLGYVPFYHVFGLCNVFLLAVCTGATVYAMPAFSLDAMLEAIPRRRVTHLHMAPPIAVMLAKAPNVEKYARRDPVTGKNAFSSVVAAVTGGAPLGHEVVVEVYKRCGFRVRLGYGLSETGSTSLQRGVSEEDMHAHAGDTGLPHWGVELRISDGNGGTAPVDAEGEILIRAPSLMTAYLPVGLHENPGTPDMSVTHDALTPDGWFRTGDVGALGRHGRLRITDRLKELIKVRAYQVAPAELEAVLCSADAVADAGVVGVYDESEATEYPRAFVVPRQRGASREELEKLAMELKELVEKRTTKYKWLVGGLVFVEQIPKSPSGKILRRVLKQGGPETKGVEVVLYQKKKRGAAKAKL
ncbi:acetyl-CoA synthetase-like protein [Echria macrotheca]|uniref:Acetyl-CoA synthetase-like protein n=1 Tax=Echria macrotheca TaxID=438768 RepID=A0AAJ0BJ36_9PEZI|nr:acetyl-CoA synthetase-like protein [Echria macrotheca]